MSSVPQVLSRSLPAVNRQTWKRWVKNALLNLLTLAAIALWFFVLRPGSLGGPATYIVVAGTSMQPGMHTGDLVLSLKQESYQRGDIVTFAVPDGEDGAGTLVIHRIVGGNPQDGFITQGDNRDSIDYWRPTPEDIRGKKFALIPKGGQLLQLLRTPAALGVLAGLFAFIAVLLPPDEKEKERKAAKRAGRTAKGASEAGPTVGSRTLRTVLDEVGTPDQPVIHTDAPSSDVAVVSGAVAPAGKSSTALGLLLEDLDRDRTPPAAWRRPSSDKVSV